MSLQFHVRLASRSEEAVHHLSVHPILKVVLDREECSTYLYHLIVVSMSFQGPLYSVQYVSPEFNVFSRPSLHLKLQ